MSEASVMIYLIFGLLLRIGIPVGVTLLLGWFIRRLDEKWKNEAEQMQASMEITQSAATEEAAPPCWEFMECPESMRVNCEYYGQTEIPCWEYFRSNGSLRPSCNICTYRKTTIANLDKFALITGD